MATTVERIGTIRGMIPPPRNLVKAQIIRVENYNKSLDKINELVDYFFEQEYWDDLRAPATTINIFGLGTDPSFDSTNGGYLFDSISTETLWVILQMPHGWSEGSIIKPHIHWFPTSTDTGNVLWRIEYKWTNFGETEAGSFITLDILDAGHGTTLKHQVAGFSDIDGTGKKISSILTIKVSRIGGDGTDTYTANALFKEFDIHYRIDARGSEHEYIK